MNKYHQFSHSKVILAFRIVNQTDIMYVIMDPSCEVDPWSIQIVNKDLSLCKDPHYELEYGSGKQGNWSMDPIMFDPLSLVTGKFKLTYHGVAQKLRFIGTRYVSYSGNDSPYGGVDSHTVVRKPKGKSNLGLGKVTVER